jgi:hypothetical protein
MHFKFLKVWRKSSTETFKFAEILSFLRLRTMVTIMKEYSIVRLKGNKIEFPEEVFKALDLEKCEYILIETDSDEKEAIISPLAAKGTDLVEINLIVKNIPGASVKVDLFLGENLINILYEEGEMMDEDKSTVVRLVDISKSKLNTEDIKKHLKDLDVVEEFEVLKV